MADSGEVAASDASSVSISSMRTTLNLDDEVLRALKDRQQAEGKSLGQVASELLARALAEQPDDVEPFVWASGRLGAKVDLEDKEAVAQVLDAS